MTSDHWQAIKALPQIPLTSLFEKDTNRVANLGLEQAGIYFDLSKTHLDDNAIQASPMKWTCPRKWPLC